MPIPDKPQCCDVDHGPLGHAWTHPPADWSEGNAECYHDAPPEPPEHGHGPPEVLRKCGYSRACHESQPHPNN